MQNCLVCGGRKWYALIDKKTGLQKTTEDGRLLYYCFRNSKHIQAEEPHYTPSNERNKASILYFDLEVSKSIYYNYGRKVPSKYLRGSDLIQEYFIISWAASYMGSSKVFSGCVTPEDAKAGNDKNILGELHNLLNSADVLAGHNVDAFDMKKVNTRFMLNGFRPVLGRDLKKKKTFDTLKIARSVFDFEENGLDALCKRFGIKGKDDITDSDWQAVFKGEEKILNKIDKYCRGDVKNGKALLEILAPYAGKATDYGSSRVIHLSW